MVEEAEEDLYLLCSAASLPLLACDSRYWLLVP